MKGVILQPSFLPWRGFFDLMYRSDVFVFLDDVQYDKRSWRNRNRIKSAQECLWITVPVITKGKFTQSILETKICNDSPWAERMLSTIQHCYSKAEYFDEHFEWLKDILGKKWENLVDLDIRLTQAVMAKLGLSRKLVRSSELGHHSEDKNRRLIDICQSVGITKYLSGPSAQSYMEIDQFSSLGIGVEFMSYQYAPYRQLYGSFEPEVSVIDLLFNEGPQAPDHIWNKTR